ncbi:GNAT family N-acetyltransferase [Pseudoalteromonas sp. T1lg65]|uniref:GNAT family N-acetyltransferase n=1 Tax=Pseudoalteromonas sp. T1lg65 TaxID=2077101 RepID=UPI003F7ACC21
MNFESERLALRLVRHRDKPQLHRILNHPLVKSFNDYGDNLTDEDVKAMIQYDIEQCLEGIGARFCILTRDDSKIIGSIGFHSFNGQSQEIQIGYELDPSYWGQGYMQEAMELALAHTDYWNKAGVIKRVIAQVQQENSRSRRVLTLLGFVAVTGDKSRYFLEL